jgi:hypothetical protein
MQIISIHLIARESFSLLPPVTPGSRLHRSGMLPHLILHGQQNNKPICLSAGSESNARVGGVIDGVVVLKELLADDGVDAGAATVGDPSVVLASGDAEVLVLRRGDQVLGGSQGVGGRAELDVEVGCRLGGERGKARAAIGATASGAKELVVGGSGDVDEGGTGVDDTGGTGRENGRAVAEAGDGDTPVSCGRATLQGWEVGERARVLRAVDTAKSELAIGVIAVTARLRLEVDTEDFRRDGALRVQVVHEGGDRVGVGNGALGKILWTKTNDSVHAAETRCGRCSTDGLRCNSQASEADLVGVLSAGERAAAVADRDRSSSRFAS